jgi:death-on-curing protein
MLIAEHGGVAGIKNEGSLDSALASPLNLVAYEKPSLFELAAKYAGALTRNHPFHDGNKRVAFTVAGVFLELNGYALQAEQAEAVTMVLGLSVGMTGEEEFAVWLKKNSTKRRPSPRTPRKRK